MVTCYHVAALVFLFFLLPLVLYIDSRRSRRLLPPGPKPLPIIGNLLDMPSTFAWVTFDNWFKKFDSDIIHVKSLGTDIVVLKTHEVAVELLERRSSVYSSRPRFPMVAELMGWDFALSLMPYGDRWRRGRRLFHESFNEKMVYEFEGPQAKAARYLLKCLFDGYGDIWDLLKHAIGGTILSTTYGIDILPRNDPFLIGSEENVNRVTAALVPGAFLVDFMPWLKYVPPWFPGASFRRKAQKWNQLTQDMVRKPFEFTKRKMKEEGHTSSFVASNLLRMKESPVFYSEKDLMDSAGFTFVAGFDTVKSVLFSFIVAMVQNPQVQRKAQAEIDEVLKGSLPTFEDRESLPYVTALVKEIFRWKPVIPSGVPHRSLSDDIYNGYLIPKGSMILANTWSIFYDEQMYPEPEKFNPDRFLKEGNLNPAIHDPELSVFGYGRRICPGRHLAQSFIWIVCASILATMNIDKALDEHGNVIEPSEEYEAGLVFTPKPFPCSVKPREKYAHSAGLPGDLE